MTVAVAADARRAAPGFGAVLAVLGIVYGDIGTSPLYAFKASLQMFKGIMITPLEIMGILSMIFWSLILIVTVKYVMLVMRADNRWRSASRSGRGHATRWRWSALPAPACSSATASSPRRSRCCRRSRGWRSPPPSSSNTCYRSRRW
jgi:hypothetical protein